MKVAGYICVYKLKIGVDCKVERYKTRMVAKGYSQIEVINLCEFFARR